MRVIVRGLKRYKDRHGRWRIYHRKSGTPIDPNLSGAELAAEVARLDRLHEPVKAKAGTLGGLLESYKQSPRFVDLAPRTKADYHKCMGYLQPMQDTPLTLLTTSFVAKLRDKTVKTKRAAFTNHMIGSEPLYQHVDVKRGSMAGILSRTACIQAHAMGFKVGKGFYGGHGS